MTTRTSSGSPVRKAARPMRDTSRDWDWINDHADELRGQWVMVWEGRLIARDKSIRRLFKEVAQEAYPEALVTYVPTVEEARRVVL
ncbi:MAG TPA: hypothetical protein VJH03_18030 [Blastocatellia bacterium]|nr:hypothetical protein [Blastocatellia bacterium]